MIMKLLEDKIYILLNKENIVGGLYRFVKWNIVHI